LIQTKNLHQQRIIYWQSKSQFSVKYDNANNSYSGFCEVTPKREVSVIRQSHGRRTCMPQPNC